MGQNTSTNTPRNDAFAVHNFAPDEDGKELIRPDEDGKELIRPDEDGKELIRPDEDGKELIQLGWGL
jgi:hypothetical protein